MTTTTTGIAAPLLPTTPAPQPVGQTADAPTISSDFETFLKMLTAQARYQDPLEPIDSTEYSAQLAQFSMVEQQVKTNDTLGALMSQLGSQNAASLSAWVGKEVRADMPGQFDGTPIVVSPKPASGADRAFLIVTDQNGSPVQRLSIPVSNDPLEWTGVDANGTVLADGTYSFAVESQSNGNVLSTDPAEIYALVSEAQIAGAEVVLLLDGGQAVSAQSVSALRNPA